jgi:Bacteriophage holin of superfamily 6 (Holin_LLH)
VTIQQIILDLLPIIVPYVICHAFLVGAQLYHRLTVKLPTNQRAILEGFASKAVAMVAQKYKALDNTQKRAYADEALHDLCKYFDIPVPDKAIVDVLIESAVSELNSKSTLTNDNS